MTDHELHAMLRYVQNSRARRTSTLLFQKRRFCWSEWPQTEELHELDKRRRFWELENLRESAVDFNNLSERHLQIHEAHKLAIKKGHFTYEDPFGDGVVESRYKHFLTGLCCGNACRHCIFNFYNVPKFLKKNKTFNSSFWVDVDDAPVPKQPILNPKQFLIKRCEPSDDTAGVQVLTKPVTT